MSVCPTESAFAFASASQPKGAANATHASTSISEEDAKDWRIEVNDVLLDIASLRRSPPTPAWICQLQHILNEALFKHLNGKLQVTTTSPCTKEDRDRIAAMLKSGGSHCTTHDESFISIDIAASCNAIDHPPSSVSKVAALEDAKDKKLVEPEEEDGYEYETTGDEDEDVNTSKYPHIREYDSRRKQSRVCNTYGSGRACTWKNCSFSHSPVDMVMMYCQKFDECPGRDQYCSLVHEGEETMPRYKYFNRAVSWQACWFGKKCNKRDTCPFWHAT